METKPLILVTNDDGVTAPGIRALIDVVKEFAEVVVVAPESAQSGMGHAVTLNDMLCLNELPSRIEGVKEYSCSGTPVDCVKIAINQVIKGKPDLCVSGVNHGFNSAISVLYSGTMSAAIEAGMNEIPAIGFSLGDFRWDANFEPLKTHIKRIILKTIEEKLPKGVVLNVNFPVLDNEEFKGVRICRQGDAQWEEAFDKRTNPHGKEYYWLTGKFINHDKGEDTDEWALNNGFISVVPVQFDLTAHHALKHLNDWNL